MCQQLCQEGRPLLYSSTKIITVSFYVNDMVDAEALSYIVGSGSIAAALLKYPTLKAFSNWKVVLYLDLLNVNQTRDVRHGYLRKMSNHIYKDAIALSNLNCLNLIQFVYERKTQIPSYQESALIQSNLSQFRMIRARETSCVSDSKLNKSIKDKVSEIIQDNLDNVTGLLPVVDTIQMHKETLGLRKNFSKQYIDHTGKSASQIEHITQSDTVAANTITLTCAGVLNSAYSPISNRFSNSSIPWIVWITELRCGKLNLH